MKIPDFQMLMLAMASSAKALSFSALITRTNSARSASGRLMSELAVQRTRKATFGTQGRRVMYYRAGVPVIEQSGRH